MQNPPNATFDKTWYKEWFLRKKQNKRKCVHFECDDMNVTIILAVAVDIAAVAVVTVQS